MRVAVIQPNYLPWRGYFDCIAEVDLFVFYDDVQYTKNDWRNRNRLKSSQGAEWITVPVLKSHLAQTIRDTRIDRGQPWVERHVKQIRANYGRAAHFAPIAEELFTLLRQERELLADLAVDLTHWAMRQLAIATRTVRSSSLPGEGTRSSRLLALLAAVGATTYVSGPAAKAYIDIDAFRAAGVHLEYKRYAYAPYPQLWGEFVPDLSIVDLLMNTGPAARAYLRSAIQNEKVL